MKKGVCYLHFKTGHLSSVNTQYMYDSCSCPIVIFYFAIESWNVFLFRDKPIVDCIFEKSKQRAASFGLLSESVWDDGNKIILTQQACRSMTLFRTEINIYYLCFNFLQPAWQSKQFGQTKFHEKCREKQ